MLRVALILDGLTGPAWVAFALERIARDSAGQVVLALVRGHSVTSAGMVTPRGRFSWGARAIEAIHRRILDIPPCVPDPHAPTDFRPLLGEAEVQVAAGTTTSVEDALNAWMAALRTCRVQLVVNFAGQLPGRSELAATAGLLWEVHHYEGTISTRHRVKIDDPRARQMRAVAGLMQWRSGGRQGTLIAQIDSPNNADSLEDGRRTAYWRSALLVPRQLHAAALRMQSTWLVGDPLTDEPMHPTSPANGIVEALAILFNNLWRRARIKVRWHRTREQWTLFQRLSRGVDASSYVYHQILPPQFVNWADPFLIAHAGRNYLFIEEQPHDTFRGHISVIELGAGGEPGPAIPVLAADHHLSYPMVFAAGADFYMVPESRAARRVTLYRSRTETFPHDWQPVINLMTGVEAVDTTILYHDGLWWMFVNLVDAPGSSPNQELHLFFSSELISDHWTAHPLNPIVSDIKCSRPAGRIFERDGLLLRPSQDCSLRYGWRLQINVIERMDPRDYCERTIETIQADWKDNILGTHTIAASDSLTFLDGLERVSRRIR